MSQQKFQVEIPPDFKPAQRRELGDLIIEHIFDRTDRGLDKNGKKFPGYSESYVKSLDFSNAGKSKGNVNLQLSGDMLAAMELLNEKRGKITIGFEKGTEENAKAEGNITGSYGKPTGNAKKARDFLGIEGSKLRELINYVRSNSKS